MSAPLAIFRADASAQIGAGHITRCLALADILRDAGWRCVFASSLGTVETLPDIRRHAVLELEDAVQEEKRIKASAPAG